MTHACRFVARVRRQALTVNERRPPNAAGNVRTKRKPPAQHHEKEARKPLGATRARPAHRDRKPSSGGCQA